MPSLKFLVVDDVAENRFLLAKTLLRKFPLSLIQECQESVPAIQAAQTEPLAAIIVHRAADVDGLSLVSMLRQVNPLVPIVMVSGRESCPDATEVGANAFLNYDAWLRIGTVVEDLLKAASPGRSSSSPIPTAGHLSPGTGSS